MLPNMKKSIALLILIAVGLTATAQLKPRADAFPPIQEQLDTKAITMANSVEEMSSWDRYPTYQTYLDMMQNWAESYPNLCHVDTIGSSVQGRLILSLYIEPQTFDDLYRPEFFYSSTIHGDEVTGFVMMLHLIDTLLSGYGSNSQYTNLINTTRISINPLANPDGTYRYSDNTVQGSRRYNANNVDLNRNFPNPFSNNPVKDAIEPENQAMIDYMSNHHFLMSANLHGGAEVMNYPWDSFSSAQQPHPAADWWREVCQRFIDTSRTYDNTHFYDVNQEGYIEGGDWYVITGGRQDYINYYHQCLELTMEISTQKTLSSNRLPEYWQFLQHSLVNYIEEIHNIPEYNAIAIINNEMPTVYPNPANGDRMHVKLLDNSTHLSLYTIGGTLVDIPMTKSGNEMTIDISDLPAGVYLLRCGATATKVVKL